MEQYIKKSALVAEIKRLIKHSEMVADHNTQITELVSRELDTLYHLISFLDTLEVKDVDTWHLQEKENIYDAVKDWSLHTFACIMKDGTIQKFTGNLDEDYEGHINVHIHGANDDYDNVNNIVKWIGMPSR